MGVVLKGSNHFVKGMGLHSALSLYLISRFIEEEKKKQTKKKAHAHTQIVEEHTKLVP